jgi:hypothetical protein
LSTAATSTAASTTAFGAGWRGRSRRRSDDDISGAHIGDVGQIPDSFFTGFATEVDRTIGQFGRGLTEQRIGATATASAATAPATAFSTGRRRRLLAQRNQSHCDEP